MKKEKVNQYKAVVEMPRERVLDVGFGAISDSDLLSMLLRSGQKGFGVQEIALDIIKNYSIKELARIGVKDLCRIPGISNAKACTILAGIELGRRVSINNDPLVIATSRDAVLVLNDLKEKNKEHFVGLYLNARNQIIYREDVSIGTINASLIHPRELFGPAIKKHACSIIIAHNHPSGDYNPSEMDIEVTKTLVLAGKIFSIEINDHIIISERGYFSFLDNGLL